MLAPASILSHALVTSLGSSAGDVVDALLRGESKAHLDPRFAQQPGAPWIAQIETPPPASRNARYLRAMGRHAMEAAKAAYIAAGVPASARFGVFAGVGGLRAHWEDMLGALENQEPSGESAWMRGLRSIHPYWMLRHLSNNAHALVSIELGLRGEGVTCGGATGGAQALQSAIRALHADAIDYALVFAYDTLLEPETIVELTEAQVLRRGAEGAPYDGLSCGVVAGEAAAALVLTRPTAHLPTLRVSTAADGSIRSPRPDIVSSIAALRGEPRSPRHVACVDGLGRGEAQADAAERNALAEQVPSATPLVCFASALGNLGAATSVVQAILLSECLSRGQAPAIAGLRKPAKGPLWPLVQPATLSGDLALGLSEGAPGLFAAIQIARALEVRS